MGYDLYGNKDNSYFRASIWSWRPIHQLIEESNVLPPYVLEGIQYNDGQHVTEDQALALADEIEKMLDGVDDKMEYISSTGTPLGNSMVSLIGALQASGATVEPIAPMYSTDAAHVREFVEFCRKSGGFEVC